MIKFTLVRHVSEGYIEEFTLSGHANYAKRGQDIVCAAVSGITFGTINAIDKLVHVQLDVKMDEKTGFFRCIVPEQLDDSIHEKVQLLLEGMYVSLQSIASEYGKYITLS
jgi:uncharacterized protein YsxB (DUF464 family)